MNKATPRVRIDETRQKLLELDGITGQSARRFNEIAQRFELFARNGFGVERLDQVEQDHVVQFTTAKRADRPPSIATMHLRRSVLRVLFRTAYETFGFGEDPTQRIYLPPRSSLSARPLTDDEIVLGRSFSMRTLNATRQPAAWALGEATATTSELPHISADDLDLDNARVWLHGSRKREHRWGELTDWGVTQLALRAQSLRGTRHLIYQGVGSEESQQASCCIAINDTLIRCGLAEEPDVHPMSLPGWAGRQMYDQTQQIDYVARRLGTRSIDAAARIIALNWQE